MKKKILLKDLKLCEDIKIFTLLKQHNNKFRKLFVEQN